MNFKRNETATKLRGGYYTSLPIASFLTRWVLEIQPERILEPSCGDGVFLTTLASLTHENFQDIAAFEIEPKEAEKARKKSKSLHCVRVSVQTRDFLEWYLARFCDPLRFDAVLGNPPFIRYQYLEHTMQARAEKIFKLFHLPFTKHTNAWVPFVISSVALLRPGGRLAMVVPAEILHVLHAESLRKFLLRECSKILIIDPEEIWFKDTLQGAVLVLAEKKEQLATQIGCVGIAPVRTQALLPEKPSTLFEQVEFVRGDRLNSKWMRAFLTNREVSLLEEISTYPHVFRFLEVADVDVGIVTGSNSFFLVPDSVLARYGLKRWAHPMFGRSEHARGGECPTFRWR